MKSNLIKIYAIMREEVCKETAKDFNYSTIDEAFDKKEEDLIYLIDDLWNDFIDDYETKADILKEIEIEKKKYNATINQLIEYAESKRRLEEIHAQLEYLNTKLPIC